MARQQLEMVQKMQSMFDDRIALLTGSTNSPIIEAATPDPAVDQLASTAVSMERVSSPVPAVDLFAATAYSDAALRSHQEVGTADADSDPYNLDGALHGAPPLPGGSPPSPPREAAEEARAEDFLVSEATPETTPVNSSGCHLVD